MGCAWGFNVGRFTRACYEQMEFGELVARDAADYVRIAVQLGADADYRQHVREELSERTQQLFDDPAPIKAHEEFFQQAIELARRN